MKHLNLLAASLFVIAGGLFMGCENQIEAPTSMTLQTRSAVEVLPAEVQFVGMVNMDAMKQNTAFNPFDVLDAGDEIGARISDFIEATGFDPEQDLSEVYFAANDLGQHAKPSFVAYATFDQDRLSDYIEQNLGDTFDRTDYQGITIYRAQEDDHELAFAVANGNMVVGAVDVTEVETMLDRINGKGRSLKDNKETMALVTATSSGSSAWFVMRDVAGKLGAEAHESDDAIGRSAEQIGRAIQNVAISITMQQNGADGRVIMQTKAGIAADDVADLTKGIVAAMKSSSKAESDKLQMLDAIKVQSKSDHVQVDFFVSNDVFASSH